MGRSRRIREHGNINAGNLLIGQLVDVLVQDASGKKFITPMRVGEIYPDSMVLLKSEDTGDTVAMQFDQDASNELANGLVYTSLDDNTGIKYTMIISSNLMSSESITKLNESKSKCIASIIRYNK